MLKHRLSLGKYLGIGVFVHWTFALLIVYAVYNAQSAGLRGAVYAIIQLFAIFLCVTLHEYGHALAARRFGIDTIDITLLPIGGVARLERMPRVPWKELVVAVAGPAVNVVIVIGLLLGLWLALTKEEILGLIPNDEESAYYLAYVLSEPSLLGFGLGLLIVNTMLVLFNMIPAFPMDGGRVFRSIAAMFMEYRNATWLASRVGLVIGFLMAGLALKYNYPMPIIIAAFIGYAGIAEARQVEVMESVRGLLVKEAMIANPASISMDTPVGEVMQHWQATSLTAMPVTGLNNIVIGMITLKDFIEALQKGVSPTTTVGELADHDVPVVRDDERLEDAITAGGRKHRYLPVNNSESQLVGLLDLNSVQQRGNLAKIVRERAS